MFIHHFTHLHDAFNDALRQQNCGTKRSCCVRDRPLLPPSSRGTAPHSVARSRIARTSGKAIGKVCSPSTYHKPPASIIVSIILLNAPSVRLPRRHENSVAKCSPPPRRVRQRPHALDGLAIKRVSRGSREGGSTHEVIGSTYVLPHQSAIPQVSANAYCLQKQRVQSRF